MKLRRVLSCVMALLLVSSLPLTAFADTWYLDEGSITVNATESGQTVTQGETNKNDDAPVITQKDSETSTTNTITIKAEENATANVTIQDVNIANSDDVPKDHSGKAAVTIEVGDNASANVTLDGVSIDVSGTGRHTGGGSFIGEAAVQIVGNGDVTLELDGENTVQSGFNRAGVEKNTVPPTDTDPGSGNGNLTITDKNETHGSLESTGGGGGSGIGGGYESTGSNITITGSAEVTAQGGEFGSGIGGGGDHGSGSNITITGNADVTAQGGVGGSGIGGGSYGTGSNIAITGSAEVTAHGGECGSGIGGGADSTGSDITASGDAQVKAQGGDAARLRAGAAIGDGGARYQTGVEKAVTTDSLNEGWIATYTPGTTDLDTTPDSLTYQENGQLTTSSNAVPVAKQEPTCTQAGHEAGFSVDGTVVAVTIPAKGHSMGAYHTETPATCQKEGVERRDCANCDYFETRPLKKVDHSYGDFASDNNATCTSDGTKTRKCIWCGLEDTVPEPGTMKEHSFTNYISNNDATYDSDGTRTAKCDTCDATDTIPDPGSRLVREETVQAEPLYRVLGQDGKTLRFTEAKKDGVLTITAEADFASLTGSFSGLRVLKARGVKTIVFVAGGRTYTFDLDDLLAQDGEGYTLTHDGEKVTFTLSSGADIGKILK